MNLKRFRGKCKTGLQVIKSEAHASYSQAGEDMIVNYLFTSLGIQYPTYLELGTNQPILCNNTYFFYQKGCKGVCIEPDKEMCKIIRRKRDKDTVLNIGIGLNNNPEAFFYLFPGRMNAWSTFSEEEAKVRKKKSGLQFERVTVPLKTINDIIEKYFNPCPNFISIDVEGIDLEILKSLNFNRFKPEVICVETITFSITNTEEKLQGIIDFMHAQGYITYGDTHINTIFCRKELFKKWKINL
jgi:FkbM family methyltransferase